MVHTAKPLAFVSIASTTALLQATAPVTDIDTISRIERLGLEGILLIIVVVLWRELKEERKARETERKSDMDKSVDAQLKMAEALTLSTRTMEEFKDIADGLKVSVDKLITVRETLDDSKSKGRHGD